jgi:two-component system response regulator EvgA
LASVKVLVVDDAPQIRARFVAMLEAIPGVDEVLEAEGVADTLAALRAHTPGVVVLDLHLRGASGLALVPEAKRDCPGAVVVVITNQSSEQHRRRCLDAGADAFLDKSRDFEALASIVAAACIAAGPAGAPEPRS